MWNADPTKSIINRYTLPLTLAIDICDEHRHSTSSFATPGLEPELTCKKAFPI